VEHKNDKMEIADIFLIFGEKCQELHTSGNHAFFEYSGHVHQYCFRVYQGKWSNVKKPVIDEYCNRYRDMSEFIETCFNQANLLMHRPEDFKVLPPQINRK
jgi:hypothetical protein